MAGANDYWVRLDRFVRGEGDSRERTELENWIDAHPNRRALADAMRHVGSRRSVAPDAHRALRRVQRHLGMNYPVDENR